MQLPVQHLNKIANYFSDSDFVPKRNSCNLPNCWVRNPEEKRYGHSLRVSLSQLFTDAEENLGLFISPQGTRT